MSRGFYMHSRGRYFVQQGLGPSPDSEAPTKPGLMVASAITETTLTLTWGASTDNVGVLNYRVEQAVGAGAFAWLATVAAPTVTVDVTGLTASTAYRFRVLAEDAAGNQSAWEPDADGLSVTTATAFNVMFGISGTVNAIAPLPDGGFIVGGSFPSVSPPDAVTGSSALAALAGASPTITPWWTNGFVYAVAHLPDGGAIIGGSFNRVKDVERLNIARINADGTLHDWNPGADSTVWALTIAGDNVIVGGQFTTLGGGAVTARAYIGAVPLASNAATSWNPGANSTVNALAIAGDNVIVGGFFTTLGGGAVTARSRIGAVPLASNAATSWNPGANSAVNALAIAGDNVIVGGLFTTLGGGAVTARAYIGAVPLASNAATSWNPGAGSTVRALVIAGDNVIVGGNFTTLGGGAARAYIGAVPLASNAATSWNPGANSTVNALAIAGDNVIVGGLFTTLGGGAVTARARIGAVPLASNAATSWNPGAGSNVNALAIAGDNVIVGGNFTTLGAGFSERLNIARINADGTLHDWNPGANSTVNALAIAGDNVIVGGNFTTLGGGAVTARAYIGAVPLASNAATSWNPGAGSQVNALAIAGDNVIVGGFFTTLGGGAVTARARIGAVPLASNDATSWNPGAGSNVNALAIAGDNVIVGGSFTTLGAGAARSRIGAVPLASNAATSWNPGAGSIVYALAIAGDNVIVGGLFTTLGGGAVTARAYIGAVPLASNAATSWNPGADSTVRALTIAGDNVIVGGQFTTLGGGAPRSRIGAVPLASNAATSWNPGAGGTVLALAKTDTDLIVGGPLLGVPSTFPGGRTPLP